MKKLIATFLIIFTALQSYAQQKETVIIIIGSIHQAAPNFNSETLLNIFEQVKPDILLQEMDSSFFTEDFKFKYASEENEQEATERYVAKYPETLVRPFEFEGRNEYRRERGMVPTDNLTIRLLKNLYDNNDLTPEQQEILKTYYDLTDQLKVIASGPPKDFNNSATDTISELRQYFQHKKLTEITNNRDEFASSFYTMPNGEKISYREGYRLWADFWDLRNKTMARNIISVAEEYPGKRIVVTTGLLHRYYILQEIRKLKEGKAIAIKEFYEF